MTRAMLSPGIAVESQCRFRFSCGDHTLVFSNTGTCSGRISLSSHNVLVLSITFANSAALPGQSYAISDSIASSEILSGACPSRSALV